ncbi:MAG: FtsW/RodA/SpoVE family cell cycle protein [Armatimonadetes bacterium]|nr:FtsW/RodA/SpoVE family cell cycle protein [Armatimonadota bacterium]
MRRRVELGLLTTALGIGAAGAALVAVARGASLAPPEAATDGLHFGGILQVWLQVGLAVLLCHLVLRRLRPTADQLLFPVGVALTAIGLAVIFSLSPGQAQRQVGWLWISLLVFVAALRWPGDLDRLRQLKYLMGLLTGLLLLLPMVAGQEINGARLWLKIGGFTLQPGELAKVTLVFFLAGYLCSRAELLVAEPRRFGPLVLPDPQLLAPLLGMWALGMAMLVLLRDLGTALLFFGTFVTMLYLATAQAAWLAAGAGSFLAGAWVMASWFSHVQTRLVTWLDPWSRIERGGYQIAQGLFAIAAGGVSGVGLGLGAAASIPAATTDFPFAAICEELGWWGAAVVVALYAVLLQRALRAAVMQPDRFRGLLAGGLGSLLALQALVILAGVTKLVPLTGITLPFVSYGGSSLLTNFLVLALLLRCSEVRR